MYNLEENGIKIFVKESIFWIFEQEIWSHLCVENLVQNECFNKIDFIKVCLDMDGTTENILRSLDAEACLTKVSKLNKVFTRELL